MATKVIKVHPFETHLLSCKACNNIGIDSPSTLVNCCLTGAPLLRDYLAVISSKQQKNNMKSLKRQFLSDADGKVYKSTAAKVKQATIYKDS